MGLLAHFNIVYKTWNVLKFGCVRAFESPFRATDPIYTGAPRHPHTLLSSRFKKSRTHVSISINMVYQFKKMTGMYSLGQPYHL
jgi:hypothetical protein